MPRPAPRDYALPMTRHAARNRALPCLLFAVLISACAKAPDLPSDRHLTGSGTFPEIQPLDAVLASGGTPALDPADAAALQSRAAALQSRAAALASASPDAATRARLDAALAAKAGNAG